MLKQRIAEARGGTYTSLNYINTASQFRVFVSIFAVSQHVLVPVEILIDSTLLAFMLINLTKK